MFVSFSWSHNILTKQQLHKSPSYQTLFFSRSWLNNTQGKLLDRNAVQKYNHKYVLKKKIKMGLNLQKFFVSLGAKESSEGNYTSSG